MRPVRLIVANDHHALAAGDFTGNDGKYGLHVIEPGRPVAMRVRPRQQNPTLGRPLGREKRTTIVSHAQAQNVREYTGRRLFSLARARLTRWPDWF